MSIEILRRDIISKKDTDRYGYEKGVKNVLIERGNENKIANKFNEGLIECITNITKKGNATEAIIEASDTYFDIKKTIKKIHKENNAA